MFKAMRLLIAFLLLLCTQSFIASTKEVKSIAIGQKLVHHITKEKTTFISTKEVNKLFKIQSFQILERIHHKVSNYYSSGKVVIQNKASTVVLTIKSIKRIKNKTDYSYRYIFNCLYPKYTFW